jgi:mRNA-degrading endonuclease RelE of RelBE toxin-antitoxin system
MTLLSESDNPLSLWKKKTTKYGEFYTIRLNDIYRLAYDIPDPKNKKIRIIRTGDHNFTYGKK